LYDGDSIIPGALQAVERVQGSGLEVRFITNTSQKTRASLLQHLRAFGFVVEESQLFTAVDAARQWLQQRQLRPFCLVHKNIAGEFADFDQRDPNAVLIADAVEGFNYDNLNRAFQLDVGAFIKAIEFGASVEATIVGKPNAEFFRQVIASTTTQAGRTLMVGDDVFGDVEGALNAGIQACLVRTGKYQPGDEDRIPGNFQLVDSITEAVELALTDPS